MVKVKALTKGYVGLVLREAGEVFEWPDGNKLGSWVKRIPFDGKGDHDGDGVTGGIKAPEPAGDAKLDSLTVVELRALAADRGIDLGGATKKADIVNAIETGATQQPTAEPFADPPPPIRVKNEINDATGGTEPDWIAPAGGETPVPADD